MSDEKERNDPGKNADQLIERHDGGEPDFEGHGNRGGDQVVERVADRHDDGGEPDFEGHRHIERHTERHVERHEP